MRHWLFAVTFLSMPAPGLACSVVTPHPPLAPIDYVRNAQIIVRAVASEYAFRPPPRDAYEPPTGRPSARIAFTVLEVLKGSGPRVIVLPGFLSDADDFSDRPVPRLSARSTSGGSCYADFYKTGGEFLLLLKRDEAGAFTARWAALTPVNEQLRGANDPWLAWVRRTLAQ